MTPDQSSSDRNPVELLAEEFISRRRSGQYPSVTEYAEKYPDHADEIRDVFPTMMMMEQMKPPGQADELSSQTKLERIGDFRIIREVGRGGMGVVYEAVQESLGRHVALKVLSNRSLHNPKRLQRFNREAHAAAKLHHTNIVPVFGAGEQDDQHYLVMQFISGQGLDKVLSALRSQLSLPVDDDGPQWIDSETLLDDRSNPDAIAACKLARSLMSSVEPVPVQIAVTTTTDELALTQAAEAPTEERAADITADSVSNSEADLPYPIFPKAPGAVYWQNISELAHQAADALDHAHTHGTYHRDIKPANLLLDGDGTVWIADFGLAKLSSGDDLTNSGDIVGTLAYMAPEQFDGKADHRSDIYGLGLTLYELATLRPAFSDIDRAKLIRKVTESSPPSPRKVNPRIPRDLETIILKAIAKEPSGRYQNSREFADDLLCFVEDRPIQARRSTPVERLWRWCRRNRAIASLSALAISMLLLAAVVASVGYWQVRIAYNTTSDALKGESEQRRTAERERERAERTLDVAIDVLDQVFDQVAPQRFSTSLETGLDDESVMEATELNPAVSEQNVEMLKSLLQFYDRFASEEQAAASVRFKSGRAYRRVGEIQGRLSRHEDAIRAYERSSLVLSSLVSEFPDNLEYRRELVRAFNGLGVSKRHLRDFSDAVDAHQEATELLDADVVSDSAARVHAYLQAETLNELGMAKLMSFRRSDAEGAFQEAISKLDGLLIEDSGGADYRMAKARVLGNLARVQMFSGRWDEGRETMRTSRTMMEDLVRDYPDVARYTYDLVDRYLAMSLRGRGISEDRRAQIDEAMRLSNELVTLHPDVPEYQILRSRSLLVHGRILEKDGLRDEAEADLRESVSVLKTLVYKFPSVTSYYFELAISGRRLGQVLTESGDLAEARLVQEESVENLHLVVQAQPQSRSARWMLSRQYQSLSETLALLGESSLAEESAMQADLIRSQLQRRPESQDN